MRQQDLKWNSFYISVLQRHKWNHRSTAIAHQIQLENPDLNIGPEIDRTQGLPCMYRARIYQRRTHHGRDLSVEFTETKQNSHVNITTTAPTRSKPRLAQKLYAHKVSPHLLL